MRAALTLVLLVGMAAHAQRFERTNSRTPQGRSVRGLPYGDDLPFFSFAPSNGVGMGEACSLPNLVQYSEELHTSPWTVASQGGPATPTRTADYAADPNGALTAERVQFGACAATTYTYVASSTISNTPITQFTASVYVKGTSAAGALSVCTTTCTPCSYTADAWTRCSHVHATADTGVSMYVGCIAKTSQWPGASSTGAADVLLAHAQANAFGTPSTYAKTTANAAGVPVTGAKGEALTFTRSSTATCTKGNPTTGIANGDLVTSAVNQPRVGNPDGLGLALLVEKASTNYALQSDALDNATWVKIGTFPPTVTANQALSPFNSMTADRVQVAATSAGQWGAVAQTLLTGTGSGSFFIRGNGTSGTIDICSEPGPGLYCAPCVYVSTSWTRCLAPTATAATIAYIGNMSLAGHNGSVARGAQDVFISGTQWEPGTYATSYIPTTSAAVTRTTEAASVAVAVNASGGLSQAHTMILTGNASFDGASGAYKDALNRTQLYQFSGNSMSADIFTTAGNLSSGTYTTSTWALGTPYRIGLSYTGAGASSTVTAYLAGAAVKTSAAGTTGAFTTTTFGFSLNSPWNSTAAYYRDACLDQSPTKCR